MRSTLVVLACGAAAALAAPFPALIHNSVKAVVAKKPVGFAPTVEAVSTGQVAFTFPLPNGFPDPDAAELDAIESDAHGTLPDGALPTAVTDTTATVLEAIAFNEIFEVAFFTSLLDNITNSVDGYEMDARVHDFVQTIRGQEELHALGANAILTSAGRDPILPCEYVFPSTTFDEAITFASEFTDLVLGVLQEAAADFGIDGDTELIGLIAAVIGQEGEQNGWFRYVDNHVPSALPFLTAASGVFGYSALNQAVVVAGTCPNASNIDIPILKPLTIMTTEINNQTTSVDYSVNATSVDGLTMVYINQHNTPVAETITNVTVHGEDLHFTVVFPYGQYDLNGMTIAAITSTAGPFTNASEVASASVYGPALIEIR